MPLWWNKSSPKEDLYLHLNICLLSVLDPLCKNFVLRSRRKVVLPDVEAEQCWHRLRFPDVKIQAFTYRRPVVSSVWWAWQEKLCFVCFLSLPSYTLWCYLSEITSLSCNKGKEILSHKHYHLLIEDDKSLIKPRKEIILGINMERFEGGSFTAVVIWGRDRQ